MKTLLSLALMALSVTAFAHPNGTYVINGDKEVTVTMLRLNKCLETAGALKGYIRSFTFSEKAIAHPYAFVGGSFVEIHEGTKEVYVQVDSTCAPLVEGKRYEASHGTFDVYSLEKL
ncbi:MAG: hypothetical protein H0V66_10240 [Bdellovibrionales bacterium]|nr:hypothetical protein [Bdellovibrionales bacterium]